MESTSNNYYSFANVAIKKIFVQKTRKLVGRARVAKAAGERRYRELWRRAVLKKKESHGGLVLKKVEGGGSTEMAKELVSFVR